jgi:hypothetical protein
MTMRMKSLRRRNRYHSQYLLNNQDLDADVAPPSEASYLTRSPSDTPSAEYAVNIRQAAIAFPVASSPTTPSVVPRTTHDIDALTDLADAMERYSRGDISLDGRMDLEELDIGEVDDLDADIEDMDDEMESSFVEGDSMEL